MPVLQLIHISIGEGNTKEMYFVHATDVKSLAVMVLDSHWNMEVCSRVSISLKDNLYFYGKKVSLCKGCIFVNYDLLP